MPARNPPIVPADTTPEVWRQQMATVGRRSVEDRLLEWAELNRAVAQMEAEAVRRRHPEYTDRQVFLALVRKRYGDDLFASAWPNEPLVDA